MICNLPIRIIKVQPAGSHLLVKTRINGKPANMLVDTGASQTVFDINRVNRFTTQVDFEKNEHLSSGLGTNTMQSHNFVIRKWKLGEMLLADYPALLLDLKNVNDTYQSLGLKPIDGVIGGDILRKYGAIINYRNKTIKFIFR